MSLNNTTADALATAICTANGITGTANINKVKTVWRQVYASLKTDITVTLAASTVVTVGSATTQTGPTTPVVLTVS